MLYNVVILNFYLLIDIIKFIYKIYLNDLFFDVFIYNFNVYMIVDFIDISIFVSYFFDLLDSWLVKMRYLMLYMFFIIKNIYIFFMYFRCM